MGHRRARAIHTTMIFHTCPQHCLKKSHLFLADSLPLYMFKASHTFLSRFQPIHSKFLLTQVVGIFVLSLLFSKKKKQGAFSMHPRNSVVTFWTQNGGKLLGHQVATLGSKATSQSGTALPFVREVSRGKMVRNARNQDV